jgi:hypothetical protein
MINLFTPGRLHRWFILLYPRLETTRAKEGD